MLAYNVSTSSAEMTLMQGAIRTGSWFSKECCWVLLSPFGMRVMLAPCSLHLTRLQVVEIWVVLVVAANTKLVTDEAKKRTPSRNSDVYAKMKLGAISKVFGAKPQEHPSGYYYLNSSETGFRATFRADRWLGEGLPLDESGQIQRMLSVAGLHFERLELELRRSFERCQYSAKEFSID